MSIKRMNEVRLVGQVEFGAALSVFAWFVLLASQANCLQQNLLEQNLASQVINQSLAVAPNGPAKTSH